MRRPDRRRSRTPANFDDKNSFQILLFSEWVITRYRDPDANLRLLRAITRAGVKPWPKLFHNLRATRQTELVAKFPIHVVCKWLGNSPTVADKHYLQVTEADFERAAKSDVTALQKALPPRKSEFR